MTPAVFVLEDNAAVLDSMTRAFLARGVFVYSATTVADAKARYVPDQVDVIITDYELPDGTGLDFLASIRGSDRARTVLWSGLDRGREVAASGQYVDLVTTKDRVVEVLAFVEQAGPE